MNVNERELGRIARPGALHNRLLPRFFREGAPGASPFLRLFLLAIAAAMLTPVHAPGEPCATARYTDLPLRMDGGEWRVRLDAARPDPLLRHVAEPERVTRARTGEPLPFTWDAGALRVEIPGDAEPGEEIVATFPESRWAKTMEWFARRDAESPPPADPVLFVGSSSIRGWDLNASFPGLATLNRGFGGSEYADVLRFADVLFAPYAPRKAVLYAGDNDVANGKSAAWVGADFAALAARIRAALPETPVYVLSIKPSVARWNLWETMHDANTAIAACCAEMPGLTFVDVAACLLDQHGAPRPDLFLDDGLHLNSAGYARWAEILGPYLE